MAEVGSSISDADGLAFAGAGTLAALVAAGDVSARELVELSLRRIDAAQPALNAFRCVRDEAALREADALDRRRARGERAPLLGVPVAIKDDMDLAGEATAFGCAGPFAPRPDDGEVARRLRAAGAVIVGKTTTPELGQWPFTEGPAFGATRNPWAPAHTPGGSSGGSAAAVAAGLVAVAAGSDGAGSVRIPAAWTHLVGLKPQRGRISTWPDPDPFNGLTCIGPLARTTQDAALLLDVLSGAAAGDRHRPAPPAEPYVRALQREPGRLRIALSLRVPFSAAPAALDAAVRSRVMWIAGVLADLGHDVEIADPAYGLIGASFIPRAMGGLGDWADQHVRAPEQLDPRTQKAIAVGRRLRPLLRTARALEARLPAPRRPHLPRLRPRAGADDRAAAAADRRDRRPRRLGDRQGDGRRLPVRVAVERARLAGAERARRPHRRRPAGRRAAAGPGRLGGAAAGARRAAGGGRGLERAAAAGRRRREGARRRGVDRRCHSCAGCVVCSV